MSKTTALQQPSQYKAIPSPCMSSPERSTEQAAQSGSSEHGTLPVSSKVTPASASHAAEPTEGQASRPVNSEDLVDLGDEGLKMATVVEQDASSAAEPAGEQSLNGTPKDDPMDLMNSSIATLKPTSAATTTATQYLTAEASSYVDPTPKTPISSQPPSRTPSSSGPRSKHTAASAEPSPTRSHPTDDEKTYGSEDDQDSGSRSEIQTIMEQFSEEGGGPGAEEVMSPRLEMASPLLLLSPKRSYRAGYGAQF